MLTHIYYLTGHRVPGWGHISFDLDNIHINIQYQHTISTADTILGISS